MSQPIVIGLRCIELAVPDLAKSHRFYTDVWGLEEVFADAEVRGYRGTGSAHHLLMLRRRPAPALLRVHLAASDAGSVNRLHAALKSAGACIERAPADLADTPGGGYGFSFTTPRGQPLAVSANVAGHAHSVRDRSKPVRLGHVVLNTPDIEAETRFFREALGFALSDSTEQMNFLRCGASHHTVAFARGVKPSLNHMAYDFESIDGLMRGCGRLTRNGFPIEWGVGRHGPGDNVFAYFIDPDGFAAEYTTEMEQVDEATYLPHDAAYWSTFPMRPCRWGLAREVSDRIKLAFSGNLIESREQ